MESRGKTQGNKLGNRQDHYSLLRECAGSSGGLGIASRTGCDAGAGYCVCDVGERRAGVTNGHLGKVTSGDHHGCYRSMGKSEKFMPLPMPVWPLSPDSIWEPQQVHG